MYWITSLSPLAESRFMVDIDIVVTISNDSGNEPLLDDPGDGGGGVSGSRTVILDQQITPYNVENNIITYYINNIIIP